jgi:DNA polymerase-3 subunit delta
VEIDSERLQAHLKTSLAPFYTVVGEEPLLAFEALDRINRTARQQGYASREVFMVEARSSWDELLHSANTGSLFGDKKILEIRIPGGKPGTEGARHLQSLVANPPPDAITLVSLPGLDWSARKSAWFQALEKSGVLVTAQPVRREALPHWIQNRLSAQHQEADAETLEFIAARVEGNLLAAWQEVQKLSWLFPAGPLPALEVKNAVLDVARYNLMDLPLALQKRDLGQFTRVLKGLESEGEALPLVIWALSEDLRLMQKLTLAETPAQRAQLLRSGRVFGPRAEGLERMAQRATPRLCQECLALMAQADRQAKGLDRADPWDTLLEMGLHLLRGTRAASAPRESANIPG